ncbi:MAG: class I SAM-dependent methyltransferase [Chryseobacterium sp.]|nr:MAG: class I SAM-dependent methyltransferase [Chryseobacterium sp.]
MKNDWYTFYANRVNSTYQDYFEKRYAPFIEVIPQLKGSDGIFELGCGIGSVSKAVGGKFKGIDNDPLMVMLANQNTNSNNFYQADIFEVKAPHSTLKVSHGVLEHFSDVDIQTICELNPNSIHYVPLDKYVTQSFGDERLLPYEYWLELVNPISWMLFNDDHDLMFLL